MMAAAAGYCRDVRSNREPDDFYQEPAWAVEALLDAEPFLGPVYDPACGEGTIPEACIRRGIYAHGTDLIDRGYGTSGVDFLFGTLPAERPVSIICNPPYRTAEAFILRALGFAQHKVAMLVRLPFIEGQRRQEMLFGPHPPARLWQFCRRVSMPPAGRGIKASGGSVAFCWLVWATDHRGPPTLGWLK